MKRWQNPHALKRVKHELEACVVKLGGALEAVINTPVDDHKDLAALTDAAKQFAQVPGTLRMLGCTHLALLAGEIQALLIDMLRTDGAELESRDLDVRLEAAFVAATDLPALLEHALRERGDSYELVFRLVNRLRKARGCAVVFAAATLVKNPDVSFRRQFSGQADKMRSLVTKQVEGLQKAAAVLVKNPADTRALQIVATVLDNLELMLRDHRGGVLWGLARALVEIYESGAADCDRPALAACFHGLVPHAHNLLSAADALDAPIDEALLEQLVKLNAGAGGAQGRPGIVRLWYNLDPAAAKASRTAYRALLVRYYNKGALVKGLQLVSDDGKRMLEAINALAESADVSRERTREIYLAIGKLADTLRMLRLDWLGDLVTAKLPASPGESLPDALALAARLLFRVTSELELRLEKLELEVFGSEVAHVGAGNGTGNRARVLQTAIQTLETITAAFDEYVDGAAANANDGVAAASLRAAHEKLDMLADVLSMLRCTAQAGHLAVARDYVAWLLKQPAAFTVDDPHRMLAHLLICSLRNLEQLVFGREEAAADSLERVAVHAQALRGFLDMQVPVAAQATRLVLVSTEQAANLPQPDAAPGSPATDVPEPGAAPVPQTANVAAPVTQTSDAGVAADDIAAIFAEEFDEVLAQLREDHAALLRDATLVATATYCRRHFHTLKGSGRMAGAERISRLAESMEKAFDVAVERGIEPSLLALTGRVLDLLPDLKTAFRTGDDTVATPDPVNALCLEARALYARSAVAETVVSEPGAEVPPPETVAEVAQPEPVAEVAPPEPLAADAPAAPAEAVDQALLAVFLDEADELLQSLDALYLQWRQTPFDKACVDEFLRVLHTIKGSAALVGEQELSRLAHDFETFIVDTRQRRHDFDPAFFSDCDTRLHALHEVCRQYQRDEAGHFAKIATVPVAAPVQPAPAPLAAAPEPASPVQETQLNSPLPEAPQASPEPETLPAGVLPEARPQTVVPPPEEPVAPVADEYVRVSSQLLKALLNDADEISFARSRLETAFQEVSALLLDMDTTLSRFKGCVKALDDRAGQPPAQLPRTESRLFSGLLAGRGKANEDFDALEMDRYTELQELALALAENYNDLQDIRASLGGKARDVAHILDGQQRLTNGLQDGLILTQMVPFASVVPRLARLVRQVGSALHKRVRLDVANQQGSLDRNILQAIITPLEHIVRNAIDHGVETAEERRRNGKPEEATLRISVARRGASFRIEIRDDGQGIDVDSVRQQAVRKGLLAADVEISAQEAYALLFRSGFSTAAAVSNISGRGVGLDVVKNEIEQIGGTVEIESTRGAGTALILNLPLTSSLNRALVFAVQDTRYAVLMNTLDGVLVEKLASVHQKQLHEGKPVFDYGGKRYEYLYLGKLIDAGFKPRLDSIDSSISLLLVGGASGNSSGNSSGNYALHIDAIVESRDLVVKSLGQQFAALPGIAGGVILPDGNVAIVLDLKALLAQQGGARQDGAQQASDVPLTLAPARGADKTRKLVMVVDDSITVRKVTTAMLKRHGMDVITARNGLEAIELLESNLPDLILLDIEMPRMDGFETASWVRAQGHPVSAIPIIMITSRIGDKHRTRAEAIGVNEYLCKPFKEDSLLKSIHSY